MFSTNDRLNRRTPSGGIDRKEFINHLVEEFLTTTNSEAQEQVSANLANFAYDPINYQFLEDSSALNVFLECIKSPNEKLVVHGIAGICNVCLGNYFQTTIVQPENLQNIVNLLDKKNTEVVVKTLATLCLLVNDSTKAFVLTPNTILKVTALTKSPNKRIENLATVFVEDYINIPPPPERKMLAK